MCQNLIKKFNPVFVIKRLINQVKNYLQTNHIFLAGYYLLFDNCVVYLYVTCKTHKKWKTVI